MKVYLSDFYQIRNMPSNYVPLSTAIYDPKWYHKNQGNNFVFVDRRGVLNGLRVEWLNPQSVDANGCPCPFIKKGLNGKCKFLLEYEKGLHNLSKDFLNLVFKKFLKVAAQYLSHEDYLKGLHPVLIFHEAPDNPCSERWPLKSYLSDLGYEVEEFKPFSEG